MKQDERVGGALVERAAVDTRGDGIVAWVLPKQTPESMQWRLLSLHIEMRLPEYMRPHRIYGLQSIPVTSNGKMNYADLKEGDAPVLPADIDLMEWVSDLSDEEAGRVLQLVMPDDAL